MWLIYFLLLLAALIGPSMGWLDQRMADSLLGLALGIFIGYSWATHEAGEKDGSNLMYRKLRKLQDILSKNKKRE